MKKYLSLIKSLQTGLLLLTGMAGYSTARCPVLNPVEFAALSGLLFFAISGSTVLNMVYDRDIDARMQRTMKRPLASGRMEAAAGLRFGLLLSLLGVGGALLLDRRFGWVVLAGWFFDVVVYTAWLKRRSAWSIVWGGISGGMPILAGRVLATGEIDRVGLALAAAVLLWIPTHIMTFSMRYDADYRRAGVPTFPQAYGLPATRLTISLSSLGAAAMICLAMIEIGVIWGQLHLMLVLSLVLVLLTIASVVRPSEKLNFGLFKYASVFMLGSMILLIVNSF